MAVGVSGCVVIESTPKRIVYRKKCEYCGYVFPARLTHGPVRSHGRFKSSFRCPKCKEHNELLIEG